MAGHPNGRAKWLKRSYSLGCASAEGFLHDRPGDKVGYLLPSEFLEIDGWVFPLSFVTKSLLIWLQASFYRWADEDASERNREWLEGIFEAFQDGLAGNL